MPSDKALNRTSPKFNIKVDIEIPTVPNFFQLSSGGSIPVSEVSEESLREIGKLWTEKLIKRAEDQRK